MDFGATAAGGAVTAALVGLIYGAHKMLQRSRCASHTACCEFEVSRLQEELQRERTERAGAQDMLRDLLVQMGIKKSPPSEGEQEEKSDIEEGERKVSEV